MPPSIMPARRHTSREPGAAVSSAAMGEEFSTYLIVLAPFANPGLTAAGRAGRPADDDLEHILSLLRADHIIHSDDFHRSGESLMQGDVRILFSCLSHEQSPLVSIAATAETRGFHTGDRGRIGLEAKPDA